MGLGHGGGHAGVVLVAVGAAQQQALPVQPVGAVLYQLAVAKPDFLALHERLRSAAHRHFYGVEARLLGRPQLRVL